MSSFGIILEWQCIRAVTICCFWGSASNMIDFMLTAPTWGSGIQCIPGIIARLWSTFPHSEMPTSPASTGLVHPLRVITMCPNTYVRFMLSRQHRYHRLALALVTKESSVLGNSQARPLLDQLSGSLARAEGVLQRENLVCSLLYLTYVRVCSPGTFSGSIIRV